MSVTGLADLVQDRVSERVVCAVGCRTFESSYIQFFWPPDWIKLWRVQRRSYEQRVPKWMVIAVTDDEVHLFAGSGIGKRWTVGDRLETWRRSDVSCESFEQKLRAVRVYRIRVTGREPTSLVELEASTQSYAEAARHLAGLLGASDCFE